MDKLDLVYILGTGSRWKNNEIRFSLRSAEKYFEFGNVFIVGELPDWIQGVEHIKYPDKTNNKIFNAIDKYTEAAKCGKISKSFILMNDDFFFMKKVRSIAHYSRGGINEAIRKHPTHGGYYYQALVDTRKRLERMGIKNIKDFEVHAPIVFEKEKLLATISIIGKEKPFLMRTCYSNLVSLSPDKVVDFKAESMDDLRKKLSRDPEYLSITDRMVMNNEFCEWIKKEFPKVSRFEKDNGKGVDLKSGDSIGKSRYYATDCFMYQRVQYSRGEIIPEGIAEQIIKNNNLKKLCRKS